MLRCLTTILACSVFAAPCVFGLEGVAKSVPVASGTHLAFDAEFGAIRIQPDHPRAADGQRVAVAVSFQGEPPSRAEYDRMLRDFRLDLTRQGSVVRVSAAFLHSWEPWLSFMLFDGGIFGNPICHNGRCLTWSAWLRNVEFNITVPPQFSAAVTTSGGAIAVGALKGAVTARTSGGPLLFEGVQGSVTGSTSGGSISLTDIRGRTIVHTSGGSIAATDIDGDLDVSTSGGAISIDGATSRVRAHTSGGPISAKQISGSIDASTSGGAVTASIVGQPRQECRLSTAGGRIEVSLSANARVNLDASTSGGTVSTDFPVGDPDERHRNQLRAPLNGGGPLIVLHTAGGSIGIRQSRSL